MWRRAMIEISYLHDQVNIEQFYAHNSDKSKGVYTLFVKLDTTVVFELCIQRGNLIRTLIFKETPM